MAAYAIKRKHRSTLYNFVSGVGKQHYAQLKLPKAHANKSQCLYLCSDLEEAELHLFYTLPPLLSSPHLCFFPLSSPPPSPFLLTLLLSPILHSFLFLFMSLL